MSQVACTKCGQLYQWLQRPGFKLADYPSPCCHAPGRRAKKADCVNAQLPLIPFGPTANGPRYQHEREV